MKRIYCMAIIAIVSLALLVACGGSDNATPPSGDTIAPTQPNDNMQVQPPTTSDDSATGNVTPPLLDDEDNGNEFGLSQDVNVASGVRVSSILASGDSSFAVLSDGSLLAWGSNNVGDINIGGWLGDGTTTTRHSPVWIKDGVISVANGTFHTLTIQNDNTLWAWGVKRDWLGISIGGLESGGWLGDGSITDSLVPLFIMNDVVSVDAGGWNTIALRNDGTLWSWGLNAGGQVGDGTANVTEGTPRRLVQNNNRATPVQILDNVVYISAGNAHFLAIRSDGTLWAWGQNPNGQLGDGTLTNRHSPIQVLDNVVAVSAGASHSMAIRSDGSLWAWGLGDGGRLGDGTTNSHFTPQRIMENVSAVSAGSVFTLAIRNDGSLWSWGDSIGGQLGTGTRREHTPVQIMDNVTAVSAGHNHSFAIQADGSVWAWGTNTHGQLGDGTTLTRPIPFAINEYIFN